MALTWERRHFDPGAVAYDGRRIVGQVARYDRTVRPGSVDVVGVYFVGFVGGDRVNGPCDTYDEARQVVEDALT